jgi:CheY-like chemotaxis protein
MDENAIVNVLVVEDSTCQRNMIERRFRQVAADLNQIWQFTLTQNGEEAYTAVKTSEAVFDLVIVDQFLESSSYGGPCMTGTDFVSWLVNNPLKSGGVIIGCTTNKLAHGPAFTRAGAHAVWQKPLPSAKQIVRRLAEINEKLSRSQAFRDMVPIEEVSNALVHQGISSAALTEMSF